MSSHELQVVKVEKEQFVSILYIQVWGLYTEVGTFVLQKLRHTCSNGHTNPELLEFVRKEGFDL